MLPPSSAWLISSFFAVSYVSSVYIFPAGRLVFTTQQVEVGPQAERARQANERWRNDPAVIRARLSGVLLSTFGSCLTVFTVVTMMGSWSLGHPDAIRETAWLLGFTIPSQYKAWFLVPLLYIGPLYVQMLEKTLPFQKNASMRESLSYIFGSWIGFRNIIAAPVTEELVFRSCIIGMMTLSEANNASMVFLSPLWFGAAHLHHGWDLYNRFGKTRAALKRAIMTVLSQQLMTSLFGCFEAFVLVRTGSILPCIFAHSFCNLYGVPFPMGALRDHPKRKIDILIIHFVGYIGFFLALGPWTQS